MIAGFGRLDAWHDDAQLLAGLDTTARLMGGNDPLDAIDSGVHAETADVLAVGTCMAFAGQKASGSRSNRETAPFVAISISTHRLSGALPRSIHL